MKHFTKSVFLLLLVISTLGNFISAQEKFSRARVFFDGKNVHELLQRGVTIDHGVHNKNYIENDFSASDLIQIKAAGFRTEMLIDDVSAYYTSQNNAQTKSLSAVSCSSGTNPVYNTPSNFSLGSMGGYFTYQEMLNQLDSMAAKYPNLISARQIINPSDLTHENRPLYWLKISDNPNIDENEPEAFYNALHHAREPASLSQLIYFMWYLLENYNTDSGIRHLLDNTELYFVPCINPDGYIYNQTTNPNGGGMWRKNRRNNGGSFGVDLNRNYGYNFAFDNTGSSGNASSDTYRGPSGFSEPETRNIRDFTLAHDFKICLNYHTYGNLLVYPWAYNGLETSDSLYYRAAAGLLTRFNNYTTGTGTTTVGYNSNGDSDDWQHGEQTTKSKVLSMTPEAGDQGFGFWPATNQIINICNSTLWQNLSHAYLLLNFGEAKEKSSPVYTQLNNQVLFDLTRYGFLNGTLNVGITPISSNIASVGNAMNYNLTQLQTVTDSISLILNSSVQNGDEIRFLLSVDNGAGLIISDTITKVFGAFTVTFSDNGTNLGNWTNVGTGSNWRVTTASFYSAPSSITDSDGTNYSNNRTSQITLNTNLDLRNVTDANLGFWAKWNIETDYDYVQVLASRNGTTYTALCGIYTNQGTVDQILNEPLFDGVQPSWVQESMSLNDFLGDSAVRIKILLKTDVSVVADGFYFDDLTVGVLTSNPTSYGLERKIIPLLGQNIPNPASESVFIPFKDLNAVKTENLRFRVVDVLGRIMADFPVKSTDFGIDLNIGHWPSGTYFYQLMGEEYKSEVLPMVISR